MNDYCLSQDIFDRIRRRYPGGDDKTNLPPEGSHFSVSLKKCDPSLGPEWLAIGLYHEKPGIFQPLWDVLFEELKDKDRFEILHNRLEKACKRLGYRSDKS